MQFNADVGKGWVLYYKGLPFYKSGCDLYKWVWSLHILPSRSQTPPSRRIWVWRTSPEILGFLTWLVRSSRVIINIFTIVGVVWS